MQQKDDYHVHELTNANAQTKTKRRTRLSATAEKKGSLPLSTTHHQRRKVNDCHHDLGVFHLHTRGTHFARTFTYHRLRMRITCTNPPFPSFTCSNTSPNRSQDFRAVNAAFYLGGVYSKGGVGVRVVDFTHIALVFREHVIFRTKCLHSSSVKNSVPILVTPIGICCVLQRGIFVPLF